jgi:hypothetical protein
MKRYFIHSSFFRLVAPPAFGVLAYLLILLINNNVAQVNDIFNSQEDPCEAGSIQFLSGY